MDPVNIYDAKKNFSQIVRRVEKGECVVICRHNQPVAELRPVVGGCDKPRPHGLAKGEFRVPVDFNAPLPDSVLSDFEG